MTDSALITGLQADALLIVELLQIDLPGGAVRFASEGFVKWAEDTFDAEDETFGVLSDISGFETGVIGGPPRIQFTILPPSAAAIASLSDPAAQGAQVQWWTCLVDPATGLLIGAPERQFTGIFDVPRQVIGMGSTVTLECGTWGELALAPNSQARGNPSYHKSIWGSLELGYDGVTDVKKWIYWRMNNPRDSGHGGYGPWVGGGGGFGGGFTGGGGTGGGTYGNVTVLPSPPPPPPVGEIVR